MIKSKKQKGSKLTPYFFYIKKAYGFLFVSILILTFSISYKQQNYFFCVKLSPVPISRCFIETKITIKKTNKFTLPTSILINSSLNITNKKGTTKEKVNIV